MTKKSIACIMQIIIIVILSIFICLIVFYSYLSLLDIYSNNGICLDLKPNYNEQDLIDRLAQEDISITTVSATGLSVGYDKTNKIDNRVYQLSEEINYDSVFMLNKGDMFEYKENYDKIPVIVSGSKYRSSKIGSTIELKISSFESEEIIECTVVIAGIINKYLSIPEFEYSIESEKYQGEAFIIMPRIYETVIGSSTKTIIINENELTETETNTFNTIMNEYGNEYYYDGVSGSLFTTINDAYYILLVIGLIIILLFINSHIMINNVTSIKLLITSIIALILSTITIIIINHSFYNLLSTLNIIATIMISALIIILSYFANLRITRSSRVIKGVNDYEEI